MDMFYVLQSLMCPPVDVTLSGGLQLQFPGLLGEVCVSQFVIQAMYLQKIGPRLDLGHKALGKTMGSPSVHSQAPEHHKEAWMMCRWPSSGDEVVRVCIWSAGVNCHIPHKAVAFLQDKNKHCNLAEWAVWYNFINLNGLCGLGESRCEHFTVYKLEQFNLKAELAGVWKILWRKRWWTLEFSLWIDFIFYILAAWLIADTFSSNRGGAGRWV